MIDDFTKLDQDTKDFFGFIGTKEAHSHDLKRAYKIINEVGADQFDIDYPLDYDEVKREEGDYEEGD